MSRTILKTWRTAYKLTDANGQTHNGCQWGPGVTNPCGKLSGTGGLCSGAFYHWHLTPELAAFLSPIHGNFNLATAQLWEVRVRGTVELDSGILKGGSTECGTVRRVSLVIPTTEQRVRFSVYCAGAALDDAALDIPAWSAWADNRLAGDLSWSAARSAARGAASATSAAWSAANAAESAAWSAASATSAAILLDAVAFALTYPTPED